jgi:zinc protease
MKHAILALSLLCGAFCVRAADVNIPVERYSLPNGLRVVLSRDNAVPVVTVYMIYDVGARSEEKGKTGFAHLFEHMMFEGSANAGKGVHMSTVESNGGILNGSTHPDFTDYYDVLPSNKLATALWLESDRMRSLSITDENLKNQKEAVKQERRLSFDNRPYSTAIVDVWPTLMYRNWSSSHSLIGSFDDLNNSSVEDVTKFFKTYYAPNDAALVIVGDIQIPETKKLIETYFGDIPSQPKPKRPDLTEPAFEPQKQTYKDVLARVPGVIVGYPGPKRATPDFYAMFMVDAILTNGDSSRFRTDLVKGKESLIQYQGGLGFPFGDVSDYRDPNAFAVFALYKPNFTGDQIVGQIQDEIAKLQEAPVDAKELARVKTLVRANLIEGLQSSMTRARVLAQYEITDGNPALVNKEIDNVMAVTAEQVQAAAKKYLTADKRSVLEIQPAPKPPAAAPKGGN